MTNKYSGWACNICDERPRTKKDLAAHYRAKHPQSGWDLWANALGESGDKFSDVIIHEVQRRLRERNKVLEDELSAALKKAKAYDDLIPQYNKLANAIIAIEHIMNLSKDGK